MIKFLGTLNMKKLDLKHEPRLRRTAFLEWITQLEIAFSSNKYTRNILSDYSTKNKIKTTKDKNVDLLVYTVAYAFMDKSTRISTSAYKNQGTKLLKILHLKCASIDSHTRTRAKMAFNNCRITNDETAINFLTRLEQKANEARNYDIRISEKKFIWTLLNNMKYHKYYKERIASFLTTFELNKNAITQKWIENKFYSIDEERMNNQRSRMFRESARFTSSKDSQINSNNQSKQRTSQPKIRCKYCHKLGHTDIECHSKAQRRPPSMPEWVSKAICSKCKKRGHLSFNCPPKYACKVIKENKSKFRPRHNNTQRNNQNQSESADNVTEFAGMAHTTNHLQYYAPQNNNCMYRSCVSFLDLF